MIPQLERWIVDCWESLAPHRPRPRTVHIAKLSQEDYPAPSAALLFMAFADRDVRPIAVAKVARIPEGDATIEREARILEQVRSHLPSELLDQVPRPVHVARVNERAALLVDALAGEVELHHTWEVRSARRSAPRIAAALEWVDRAAAGAPAARRRAGEWLGGTPQENVRALAGLDLGAEAQAMLEPCLADLWSTAWPCGLAHGDFFPGNLLFGSGAAGRAGWRAVAVVDWMLAELASPGFFDPLLYELSFSAQALRRGLTPGIETIRAVNALSPFAEARRRWTKRGIDIGIGSPARVATLVHAALRDGSVDAARRSIARCWTRLLEIELAAAGAARPSGASTVRG